MRDNIITGVLLSLITLLIGWYIRRQNRRDREFIKSIVKEELQDALLENKVILEQISKNVDALMKSKEDINKQLLERLFKDFK